MMRSRSRHWAMAALLVVWPLFAQAGAAAPAPVDRQSISGKVQRITGEGVFQAEVSLFNAQWQGKALFSTLTDRRGKFRFDNVPGGLYVVRIVKKGFDPLAYRVQARSGLVPLSFTLRPAESGEPAAGWSINSVLRTKADRKSQPDATPRPQDNSRAPVVGGERASAPPAILPGARPLSTDLSSPGSNQAGQDVAGKSSRFVITSVVTDSHGNWDGIHDTQRFRFLHPKGQATESGGASPDGGLFSPVKATAKVQEALQPFRSISAGVQERFHIEGDLSMVYAFDVTTVDPDKRNVSVNPRFHVSIDPAEHTAFRFGNVADSRSIGNPTFQAPFGTMPAEAKGFGLSAGQVSGPRLPSGRIETRDFRAFLDELAASGRPFVAILKRPELKQFQFSPPAAKNAAGTVPLHFDLNRRWTDSLPSSVIYVYGEDQPATLPGNASASVSTTLDRNFFQTFSNAMGAKLPSYQPEMTTFKPSRPGPSGTLLPTFQHSGDLTFSLFLREVTPLSEQKFGNWDSVFDMRLLLGYGVQAYETPSGDLILVHAPKTDR